MPLLHRLAPVLAAALLAAAAVPPAAAQSKTLGSGKGSGPVLTRDQLRECLSQQGRLKARADQTLQLQAQLEKEKSQLKERGDALRDELAALDRTNQELIDRHNAQAAEHDRMIDEYQARAAGFNAQAGALKADRAAWARGCENRRYDEKDEALIKAGK